MWARIVEITVGCWLAMSPFIFNHPADATFLWANDFAVAVVVITIASISISPRLEKVHFLNLLVSAYLILISYLAGTIPPPAPYQNYMVVALLIIILAAIPSRGTLPPRSWQAFYEEKNQNQG